MGKLRVDQLEVDRIANYYRLKLDNETGAEAKYEALTKEIAKAEVLEASYVQQQIDRTEKRKEFIDNGVRPNEVTSHTPEYTENKVELARLPIDLANMEAKREKHQKERSEIGMLMRYQRIKAMKLENEAKMATPKMGGIVETANSREPWTGGKPKNDWSDLESSGNKKIQPTQIRSMTAKGATSMNDRLKGIYTDSSSKFKHHSDLDFFCRKLEEYFERHGLDTIAYRRDPAATPPAGEMLSVFTNYPKFSMEEIKLQNEIYVAECDEFDKQNDKEAIICFLNCLDDQLHQDIWTRIESDMLFTEVFMIFIQHERPQNGETYDSLEQKLINFDNNLKNYAGSNTKDICADMRKMIKGLV